MSDKDGRKDEHEVLGGLDNFHLSTKAAADYGRCRWEGGGGGSWADSKMYCLALALGVICLGTVIRRKDG